MKAIIVDDERKACKNMQMKLQQIPVFTKTDAFTDPFEALAHLRGNPVDIAFLDIEMCGISGIEMAKQIKDIDSRINIVFVTGYRQYAVDAFSVSASDYILKPATVENVQAALAKLRNPVLPQARRIRIQTFGNFEVFVDGRPLQMTRTKPKELLAYLVDRQGTSVTKAQIAAVLWENKEYNRPLQKRTSNIIAQMLETLRDAGMEDIVFKHWNNFAIDVSKFDCDYYQFLKGDIHAINNYAGEYMNEYSWAEMTAAMLALRK